MPTTYKINSLFGYPKLKQCIAINKTNQRCKRLASLGVVCKQHNAIFERDGVLTSAFPQPLRCNKCAAVPAYKTVVVGAGIKYNCEKHIQQCVKCDAWAVVEEDGKAVCQDHSRICKRCKGLTANMVTGICTPCVAAKCSKIDCLEPKMNPFCECNIHRPKCHNCTAAATSYICFLACCDLHTYVCCCGTKASFPEEITGKRYIVYGGDPNRFTIEYEWNCAKCEGKNKCCVYKCINSPLNIVIRPNGVREYVCNRHSNHCRWPDCNTQMSFRLRHCPNHSQLITNSEPCITRFIRAVRFTNRCRQMFGKWKQMLQVSTEGISTKELIVQQALHPRRVEKWIMAGIEPDRW